MIGLKQVADVAGVSASTVSRVLNGKSYVNEETRKKVLMAVEKTNYKPNAIAKSLKEGRTNMICLMVPAIENPIVPFIVRGVEDTARKLGFSVVLCNTGESRETEAHYIDIMTRRVADGFIFVSANGDEDKIYSLHDNGVPVVIVNRFQPDDVNRLEIVTVDNYKAGYDATKYLISCGRRRIAFAYGRNDLLLYRERYRGYTDALKDAGIGYDESLVMREEGSEECFYGKMAELMKSDNPPDAVFASSDPKAFIILHSLHDMNYKIPEDVAVIGFDDVQMAEMVEPPLTTVAQPLYDMGCKAAERLIARIGHKEEHGVLPPAVCNVLDYSIVVRKSAGKPIDD